MPVTEWRKRPLTVQVRTAVSAVDPGLVPEEEALLYSVVVVSPLAVLVALVASSAVRGLDQTMAGR